MNKDYNRHLFYICVILVLIINILVVITRHSKTKDNVCGIDSAYIVDSLKEEYDNVTIDTIIKVDINGNVYKTNN